MPAEMLTGPRCLDPA